MISFYIKKIIKKYYFFDFIYLTKIYKNENLDNNKYKLNNLINSLSLIICNIYKEKENIKIKLNDILFYINNDFNKIRFLNLLIISNDNNLFKFILNNNNSRTNHNDNINNYINILKLYLIIIYNNNKKNRKLIENINSNDNNKILFYTNILFYFDDISFN